jgi:purine-binding chemotaxis protein CheW
MVEVTTSTPVCAGWAGEYPTFHLGRESSGIQVLSMREIIRLTDITSVPHMPESVGGAINLRGKIMPVANLRSTFGIGSAETCKRTCIAVVQAGSAGTVKSLVT